VIEQLFIVTKIDLNLLRMIRRDYPHSRVAFWDGREPDQVVLRHAAQLAARVIAEKELAQQVSAVIGEVTPLDRYDGRLARRLDRATRAANGRIPVASADYVFQVDNGPVLFCPSNDTHVKMFEPISNCLSHSNFLRFDDRPAERAEHMLNVLGLEYVVGGPESVAEIKPSVVVVAADWYAKVWDLLEEARLLRIPTVCVQEGCLDFERHQRMQRCDYPFVQGPIMLKYRLIGYGHFVLHGNGG